MPSYPVPRTWRHASAALLTIATLGACHPDSGESQGVTIELDDPIPVANAEPRYEVVVLQDARGGLPPSDREPSAKPGFSF
jgi:hypothetical protein